MGRTRRTVISLLILVTGVGITGAADGRPVGARAIGVGCEAPRTLRLERYEDGSAKLLCNGRVLVRVSVRW